MRSPIFIVDAFSTPSCLGNPAAVMPMGAFPEADRMQSIAAGNGLSETAFLVAEGGDYRIRWFTPAVEVPLCGHATLASAAVVMERLEPGRTAVTFQSASGPLAVKEAASGYVMDLPARPAEPVPIPADFAGLPGVEPIALLANAFNYMAVLADAAQVRRLSPDLTAIARLDRAGLIVTAPGDDVYDCVSRYFAPAKGIDEDPATGGAHCMIAPYWAARLGRPTLRAHQASARGGEMICRVAGGRVVIEGACIIRGEKPC